ncbi:MAG TPA: aldo/keto reductase [Solirubrobacteraceae bacterium]|nr:aldo/keto reductase [Solirubrobacteraceae bacterium]
MTPLGATDLDVFPLCLGGNVFGWTADRDASFAVLDAYAAAGGNFIDTADVYPPGGEAGESERIIGRWLAGRGRREELVIATKVGMAAGRSGLDAQNILAACDDSLGRLGLDHIDLYYAHRNDPETPLDQTLRAFDDLIAAGKICHFAVSNFSADRLAELLRVADEQDLRRPAALQPHFNLVERGQYEGELQDLCERERIACVPYYGLARGFLTGKYRPGGAAVDSPRAGRAAEYLQRGGERVLEALDAVAAAHGAPHAAVALAWLRAQPTVIAPIASARTPEQLKDLLPMATLDLSPDELTRLTEAAPQPV